MDDTDDPKVVRLSYEGRLAVITIDNPTKLNALSLFQYYDLASKMREVAARDDVYVTLLTGTGRFFSACVDVCSCSFSYSFPLFSELPHTSPYSPTSSPLPTLTLLQRR